MIVTILGALTIGWGFMLYDLDVVWTRLTMSLAASFTNLGTV
jgi:hypothetical protein